MSIEHRVEGPEADLLREARRCLGIAQQILVNRLDSIVELLGDHAGEAHALAEAARAREVLNDTVAQRIAALADAANMRAHAEILEWLPPDPQSGEERVQTTEAGRRCQELEENLRELHDCIRSALQLHTALVWCHGVRADCRQ